MDKGKKIRQYVDIFMEPIATFLLFGLGIFLIASGKVEAGIGLATSSCVYWFNNKPNGKES